MTNHDDPSYSCRGSAVADLISPEPEQSAAFRHDFFDSGQACNRDARLHVALAVIVLGAGAGWVFAWERRRRRGMTPATT